MSKKDDQLGMNYSTASGRLVKDLLWDFVKSSGKNNCYHCNLPMTREDFSIEHKTPWLDSENPKDLFFDISNISYSHLSCNCRASRRGKYDNEEDRLEAKRKSNRESLRRARAKKKSRSHTN